MHMLATHTLCRALAALLPAYLLVSTVSAQAQQAPGVPSHQERGNLILEGIPPLDTALAARLERYQQSRQATFLDWQADGSMLVATRFGEVSRSTGSQARWACGSNSRSRRTRSAGLALPPRAREMALCS